MSMAVVGPIYIIRGRFLSCRSEIFRWWKHRDLRLPGTICSLEASHSNWNPTLDEEQAASLVGKVRHNNHET